MVYPEEAGTINLPHTREIKLIQKQIELAENHTTVIPTGP